MEKVLEDLGLTKNEVKIYLSLLDKGPSLAGFISQITGVHRRSVYDAVERLIKKGLIGYIKKNNRKYFEAVNPEKLLELVKEKEYNVIDVLPKLKEKFKFRQEKQETNFFKGKDGLKNIFEDQLKQKNEILILGASPIANKILKYYFHWFDIRRKKENIKVKIIAFKDTDFSKVPLAEVRYLPKKYTNPAAFNIYSDKVAILLWSEEKPLAILIKNKDIAESYKKYFELMWTIAKR